MIIPLKQSSTISSKTPIIIFIHPVGGTLFTYSVLIRQIKTTYQIFGIQDGSTSGNFKSFNSLEEQAYCYLKLLKSKFHLDNIILIGHSYGGSLAFEIARQCFTYYKTLIPHLIMLDSWAYMPFDRTFQTNFKKIILRQITKIHAISLDLSPQTKTKWENTLWERMELLLRYKPTYCPINATLFTAMEPVAEYTVPSQAINNWYNHVNNLQIIPVIGNHENMLDYEHADYLCNYLTLTLKKITL